MKKIIYQKIDSFNRKITYHIIENPKNAGKYVFSADHKYIGAKKSECRKIDEDKWNEIQNNQKRLSELEDKVKQLKNKSSEIFKSCEPAFEQIIKEYNFDMKKIEHFPELIVHKDSKYILIKKANDIRYVIAIAENYILAKYSARTYLQRGNYAKGSTEYYIYHYIGSNTYICEYIKSTIDFDRPKKCFDDAYTKFCKLAKVEKRKIWGKQTEIY